MKIDRRNPRHWLLLALQAIYTWIGILARPLTRRPAKPVVVLYGHQLSGNLKALYEQWQKTHTDKFDCYFLSLDPDYCKILKTDEVNVLQCGRLKDMLLVARSSAIVTDHGLHMMSPLVRFTDIKFIDVWHGIPFKGFIPDDFRLQHRYDEVWVSSPLLRSIYIEKFGFRPETVIDMGYARADRLFRGDTPEPSYRQQAKIPAENKLVLYAPTWQQDHNGHELFPFGESQESFIAALSEVCSAHTATLVIRSHLNARISERQFDNVLYCPMKAFPDTEGLLLETDLLICDWSSIAFDYLALDRPAIFVDVPSPYRNGFSLGPEYRFGKVVEDTQALREQLEGILKDPRTYYSMQGDSHASMVREVYGDHLTGLSSAQQLEHLEELFLL